MLLRRHTDQARSSGVDVERPCHGKVLSSIPSSSSHAVQSHFLKRWRLFYISKPRFNSGKCGGQSWFRTNTMPQNRYSYQDAPDTNVLNPQVLDAPDGLATALRAIEAACHRGDSEIAGTVEVLNSRSYLLEYLISGTLRVLNIGSSTLPGLIIERFLVVLEEGAYARLSKWIVTGFPTSTRPSMNAISMRLLERFSSSLPSVEYPPAANVTHNLRASQKTVKLSLDVLKNLEENASSALIGGNVSHVSRKKGKAATHNHRVDPLPFDSMGIAIPTTDAEVCDVYVRILLQLRSTLEVCGSTAHKLRIELNNRRTISSFSGNQCYRKFSNPHTPRQNHHRKELLPQYRQRGLWNQIKPWTQRFL